MKVKGKIMFLVNRPVVIQGFREVHAEDLLERQPVRFDNDGVPPYLENRVIMVTGGGGSVGSELCRQIAGYGPRFLIVLDNYENNAYYIQNELKYKHPELNLKVVIANIREKDRLGDIFRRYRPDVVFHAAAHKHVPLMEENPGEAVKNNIFGTLNLAECSVLYGVQKFVLISTDKAVNPTSIMGATKKIAEMIVQAYDRHGETVFTAVRFGNVLGSSGSVVALFKKQIERGGPVTVTHPEVTRFFMTITEAVQLVIQSGAMAKGGEIFVLDMGEPVKIYDLARKLIRLYGLKPGIDIEIEFTGLRSGEKLYEELLLAEEGLKGTSHSKIFVAQPVFIGFDALHAKLDQLRKTDMNDTEQVIGFLKDMVPAYKPEQ